MILINDLTLSYSSKKVIIDQLKLTLEDNMIHGIVGLNGAGKTTLLNAIYGLKKKQSGEIKYFGQTLTKKDISYLVSENFFYSNITGKESIAS